MADAVSSFRRLASEVAQDTGYAVRTLRREPALLSGIVLTLALALGVNAAMFGVVSRLLFSPPAGVAPPESVYRVNFAVRSERGEEFVLTTTSYPAFEQLQKTRAFAAVAAVRTLSATADRAENLAAISVIAATGNYFEVLGAQPQLGRFFGPADDELPLGSSVVVLSNEFWRRRFAGQRNIIGSQIVINNQPFTVIGVAAPRFTGDAVAPVDAFLPLSAALRNDQPGWWSNTRMNVVSLVARVSDDIERAAQRATSIIAELDAESPRDLQRSVRLESLVPGKSARATPRGRIALWLSGVTIVVLLTAAANRGTLLLLRAARRRRDLSVRLALGIGRARMLRQLAIESLVLAFAGGAAGLLVSHWMAELLRTALFQDLAPSEQFVDRRVLLLTAAASLIVGLLAALSPLAMVARLDISNALKSAERSSIGRSRTRIVLVSAQVGLSTVLLVGAGLFVRSLERVKTQDLGYSLEHLLFVTLDFTQRVSGLESDRLHILARDRIARVQGVLSATEVQALPFGSFHVPPMSVPGLSEFPNVNGQPPFMYGATPAFLQMMDVKLRAGRLFNEGDTRAGPNVVLINETMAREVWPNENALGKCIRIGHDPSLPPTMLAPPTLPCREVVGIVRDSRVRSLRLDGGEASLMQFYVPFDQLPPLPFHAGNQVNGLLARVSGDPHDLAGAVQRAVQRNFEVPVFANVRPYQELLSRQMRPWRLGATLFSAFGALALVISAVGLFAMIAYLTNEQTKALGIRLALGAEPGAVRRLVITNALKLVAAGLVAGVMAALILGRFTQDLLFQTSARDPVVIGGAAGTLLLVTILAAALPSFRAGRVNPLIAFRAE